MKLNKKRFIIPIIVLVIIIGAIVVTNNMFIFNKNNMVNSLEHKYKQNYPKVLSYEYVNIKDYSIVDVNSYYSNNQIFPNLRGKNNYNTVMNILTFIKKIPYELNQNNPNKYKSGLNCQGYSLLFQFLCSKYNIKVGIKYTSNHMYNILHLDGKVYKVDITNNIMKEIN